MGNHCALANFSMPNFSSGSSPPTIRPLRQKIRDLRGADENFVGIMSQGTSGDAWWGDYSQTGRKKWTTTNTPKDWPSSRSAYRTIEYRR